MSSACAGLRLALTAGVFGALGAAARDAAADVPATCSPRTTCAGHSGYYASSDDLTRVAAVADPILRDLRRCLDGVGARQVTPALVMRWDAEGSPVEVKIDAPGYESLPCVTKAESKLSVLQNPHETSMRCEYGCPKPATTTPPPPPVVTGPPAPTQPAPVPSAPAPAPEAAPAPAPSRPPERFEKVWYGWQTLIADGISFTAIIGGTATKSTGVLTAGIVGFVFATPIVHMAHANVGPGIGSIGLRVFMPLTGMGIGALTGLIIGGTAGRGSLAKFGEGANGAATGAVLGTFIGGAASVLIDAAGLAYTKERVDEPTTTDRGRGAPLLSVAPSLDVGKDRAALGLAGRF